MAPPTERGTYYGRVVTLEEVTFIHAPRERCFDLARSIEVHLLGNTHFGEQAVATSGVTTGLIDLGQSVTWRAKHLFVRQTLTSQITAMKPPESFQDSMISGAFKFMQHDHFFEALSGNETRMNDVFRFSAPIPILGRIAEVCLLSHYMKMLLRERNAVIKQVAESEEWRRYLPLAETI